jgi:peptidoglycan/xylan/chitin deacetylase (PgdA/CDA1 family)
LKFWWGVVWALIVFAYGTCEAAVITRLPGDDKVIALTFDACETKTPSYLDQNIVDYLLREGIAFTVFVSGKFAVRNAEALKVLARNGLVAIENHSLRHKQHMERLGTEAIIDEVMACERLVTDITGDKPLFFRFPAGNYDQRTVRVVEGLGYRVVHWTFASGDPAKEVTPKRLSAWVLGKTRPGDILIFHINGRGYSTAEALPGIVQQLRQRGYRFVLLKDILGPGRDLQPQPEGVQ